MTPKTEFSLPKHAHLKSKLGAMILDGTWSHGHKLPSEKQISNQFGVSRTTVTRALKDMERDGLILRRQGSGTYVRHEATIGAPVGILIPGLAPNDIFLSVQHHIHRQSSSLGWQLVPGDVLLPGEVDAAGKAPVEAAERLVQSGIKGVIVVPHHVHDRVDECSDANDRMLNVFQRAKVPVVLLDRDICESPDRSTYDLISLDNRRAGFEIAKHLNDRNRKSFVFLGDPVSYPSTAARLAGIRDALSMDSLDLPNDFVFDADSTGVQSALKAVKAGRIDAVVCNSDHDAAILMRELLLAGIEIPKRVAIAGFDDQPIAKLLAVPLTTIAQPLKSLAIRVVSALKDRMAYPELAPTTFRLRGELVVREST